MAKFIKKYKPLTLEALYFGIIVRTYPMERTFQTIQQQYKILRQGPADENKKIKISMV